MHRPADHSALRDEKIFIQMRRRDCSSPSICCKCIQKRIALFLSFLSKKASISIVKGKPNDCDSCFLRLLFVRGGDVRRKKVVATQQSSGSLLAQHRTTTHFRVLCVGAMLLGKWGLGFPGNMTRGQSVVVMHRGRGCRHLQMLQPFKH